MYDQTRIKKSHGIKGSFKGTMLLWDKLIFLKSKRWYGVWKGCHDVILYMKKGLWPNPSNMYLYVQMYALNIQITKNTTLVEKKHALH